MKKPISCFIILSSFIIVVNLFVTVKPSEAWPFPVIIDHSCTDLSSIPPAWIDSVKAKCKLHYAHTSHGGQLTIGLDTLWGTDHFYGYDIDFCNLPLTPGMFCIHDGQTGGETYITPDLYWQTAWGMNLTRTVLTDNPTINYSMWSWCTQVNYYSAAEVQEYLDSLAKLESEYPAVTFIYMTGNAQATGWDGYNRHQNNNLIRQYCTDNNKVLFDFADLDAWSDGEQHTYIYDEMEIPAEHPDYYGDIVGHTTWESCLNKGKALWWMMATLTGWDGGTVIANEVVQRPDRIELNAYPNPFNSSVKIGFGGILPSPPIKVGVFDITGCLVKEFFPENHQNIHKVLEWNPHESVTSGIYMIKVSTGNYSAFTKVLYLK